MLKLIKLKELRPHPDGCRSHQPYTSLLLANAVKAFGGLLRPPFVLNSVTGNLIDGDQMRAALLLVPGYGPDSEVPVWVVEVPEHLEDAAHLALQNHAGEWLWQRVSDHLKALPEGLDKRVTGFQDSDIGPLTAAEWSPAEKKPLDGSQPEPQQGGLF